MHAEQIGWRPFCFSVAQNLPRFDERIWPHFHPHKSPLFNTQIGMSTALFNLWLLFLLFLFTRSSNIWISNIPLPYLHRLHSCGCNTNSYNDQLPVGLIAQLEEHCTGIAEVMGSNPVQAWIFFRLNFRNCLSCVFNCDDHSLIHSSFRSHIFNFISSPKRVYIELTEWPAPSWLDSSIGRALHRYRRCHGFESRQAEFLRFLFATAY